MLLELIEKNKDLRKIVAAIEAGAELNEKSNKYRGYTALHEAVEREDLILVDVLMKAGANPNIKTGHPLGRTPLHIAAALSNDLSVLELLIGTGAEIKIEDRNGRTPLYHAIRNGNSGAVKFLLENGATTKSIVATGQSALHLAVMSVLFISSPITDSPAPRGLATP